MGMLKQIDVDCRHPARLARFWADALDDFEVLHYDNAEIAHLAGLGSRTFCCRVFGADDLGGSSGGLSVRL